MPRLYMMVGIPASGKSTWVKENGQNCTVYSSDSLREKLGYADGNLQDNRKLFTHIHEGIKKSLLEGNDVIFDATNINRKKRISFLQELSKIPCEKICVFLATPFEECLKRNSERDRVVPEKALKKMLCAFNVPSLYEGFDRVEVVGNPPVKKWDSLFEEYRDFNQDNSHHGLTLGEHCRKAYEFCASKDNPFVVTASALHDCGKPFVKNYKNAKGEVTSEAHYYNHNNAGAYESFSYQLPFASVSDRLYTALLIEYHMYPFLAWKDSEKSLKRDTALFGQGFIDDIYEIHRADLSAH